jgi:hypothetical protein
MVEVDLTTKVIGADGPVSLIDVFDGRRQLIVYFQMWHTGRLVAEKCEGSRFSTTHINELSYLNPRVDRGVPAELNVPKVFRHRTDSFPVVTSRSSRPSPAGILGATVAARGGVRRSRDDWPGGDCRERHRVRSADAVSLGGAVLTTPVRR